MGRARQTFERRQLGLTLRRLREQANLTQQAAAEAIGRVRSRIVELEEGKGTLNQEDLAKLLDCYQVSGTERQTALAVGAQARKRQRGGPHTDILPDSFRRFADLEASAAEIMVYESGLIPGLLQSPAYVRAIIADGDGVWWEQSESEVSERIAFRLDRQRRIWSTGEQLLHLIITEDALRAPVDSAETMRQQLRHIVGLIEEHPNLTVQVLPQDSSSNPARGDSFTLFSFGTKAPPIGLCPAVLGTDLFFDEPADTDALRRAFARLSDVLSLDPVESTRLIINLAGGI